MWADEDAQPPWQRLVPDLGQARTNLYLLSSCVSRGLVAKKLASFSSSKAISG